MIPTIPNEFNKKSEVDRALGVASKSLLLAFLLTDRVLWLQKLGLVRSSPSLSFSRIPYFRSDVIASPLIPLKCV